MDGAVRIEWEDVDCMLCGGRDSLPAGSVEWRGNPLSYRICSGCGLKFMNPRPTEKWYRDFYEQEFWEDKFENRSWRPGQARWLPWHWFRKGFEGRLRKGRARAREVVPIIAEHAGLRAGSRVLDVGCAFGLILEELKRSHGCELYGIEPSRVARDHAERTCGVSFIGTAAEDIPGLSGYDEFFDLIVMSNVLENIVEPRPILAGCRRLLKPHGHIYVETPNFFYYDSMNPYHPYIYSAATLSMLLAQEGLEATGTLYKAAVGAPVPEGHVDRANRRKFVTVFARPGERLSGPVEDVEVDKLLEWQRLSLASLAA